MSVLLSFILLTSSFVCVTQGITTTNTAHFLFPRSTAFLRTTNTTSTTCASSLLFDTSFSTTLLLLLPLFLCYLLFHFHPYPSFCSFHPSTYTLSCIIYIPLTLPAALLRGVCFFAS